jgi:hypothetical protein
VARLPPKNDTTSLRPRAAESKVSGPSAAIGAPPALIVTVGEGRTRPKGRRLSISNDADLAETLSQHWGDDAWFSLHEFRDAYRHQKNWRAASGIGIDIDYHDSPNGKGPPVHAIAPKEKLERFDAAFRGGDLVGSLFYRTPRGARLVFLFDAPEADRARWLRAGQVVEAQVANWLVAARLSRRAGGAGFQVDSTVTKDSARFLYSPNAKVDGQQRRAEVLVSGRVYNSQRLAEAAPHTSAPVAALPRPAIAGPPVIERARKYLAAIPGAVSGQGGHDQTWKAALAVVRGLGLDADIAYELLATEYNPRCQPRWSERELRHKVGNAAKDGRLPAGFLLEGIQPSPAQRARLAPAPEGRQLSEPPPVGSGGPPLGSGGSDNTRAGVTPGVRFLSDLIAPLSVESLSAEPPRRDYLLSAAATGKGVLVRGRVGLLAARGGTGKTLVLVQLAIAVATETAWFGSTGWKAAPGRVLLLLAEEDAPEVLRRFHHAARMAGVTGNGLDLLVSNITSLPLCGHGVALTAESDHVSGELPETPRANEVRQILRAARKERRPYSLVILDPLSRFAGADVEKDNSAATRFVQVVETFVSEDCGGPTVLLAHHWRKSGRSRVNETADPIRGASAIVDGVRWAATLESSSQVAGAPDLLKLRVVKTNYAPTPEPLTLCRPLDGHGCLRVAQREEEETYKACAGPKQATAPREAREEHLKKLRPRILDAVRVLPDTGTGLALRLHARKELVGEACRTLALDGLIRRQGGDRSPWRLKGTVPGTVPGAEPSGREGEFLVPAPPLGGGTKEPTLGGSTAPRERASLANGAAQPKVEPFTGEDGRPCEKRSLS